MVPTDTDRLYDMLREISAKLDVLAQDTGRRISVLEERGSAARFDAIDKQLSELQQFKASARVYIAAAGVIAASVTTAIAKLVHLG